MAQQLSAQIQGVEVAHRLLAILLIALIVAGRGVEVPVAAVEMKIAKLLAEPRRRIGLQSLLGEIVGKAADQIGEVREATAAFQGLEVVALAQIGVERQAFAGTERQAFAGTDK